MSTIPTPITIYHAAWTEGVNDAHGNPTESYAAWVARKVQGVAQFGRRGSSHEIVDVDYLARVETVLEIGVADVTVYSERDLVLIGATGVDGDGNPVGGTAFHVESYPDDNRLGPFPLLNKILGGVIRVRRVT
jgi:hypothetical protein